MGIDLRPMYQACFHIYDADNKNVLSVLLN